MGWGLLLGYVLFSGSGKPVVNEHMCHYLATASYTFRSAQEARYYKRKCAKKFDIHFEVIKR